MNDWIDVYAKTSDGDWDRYAFTVLVDGAECPNFSELQAGEALQQLDCPPTGTGHSTVRSVSVRTPSGDMRCERNAASTDESSLFACAWR